MRVAVELPVLAAVSFRAASSASTESGAAGCSTVRSFGAPGPS